MPLPSSGPISLADVNVELGLASTTTIDMNQPSVRTLFATPSGAIAMSNGYGKSNRVSLSVTYAANSTNQDINISNLSGYQAGITDVTITVNANIYVYSTSTSTPGLSITGGAAGDTCTLVNNGFILGMGGRGDSYNGNTTRVVGTAGGNAISLGRNVTITNNSYIAGGGGGGAGGAISAAGGGSSYGGGGGAGGGAGGNTFHSSLRGTGNGTGGSGGGPNSAGSNGAGFPSVAPGTGGGGGGRILPGTGGIAPTTSSGLAGGGGAGGGGGFGPGINQSSLPVGAGWGGGGGGWGASGGASLNGGSSTTGAAGGSANNNGANGPGITNQFTGQVGGRAIALNGFSATFAVQGTLYGGFG